ncbi:MAG: chemotaxis protein CheX [Myxococcales bacterium FL481]|nr:MAG: chemotaxis protein CheX [Myxococcales bacterium FL481]
MNQEQLSTIANSIFEAAAFVCPDEWVTPAHGTPTATTDAQTGAIVRFHGAANGWLLVAVHGDIETDIAANMLGRERVDTSDTTKEAIKEIANMICGRLMFDLGDHDRVVCEPPQWLESELQAAVQSGEVTGWARAYFDNGTADIVLSRTDLEAAL